MASITIQIERRNDTDVLIRSRVYGAAGEDKDIARPIDWNLLEGLPVPEERRLHAGALISLIFKLAERTVSQIEIRFVDYANFWVAAAQIDEFDEVDGGQVVYRQGIGETLIDALVDLSYDIQQYE